MMAEEAPDSMMNELLLFTEATLEDASCDYSGANTSERISDRDPWDNISHKGSANTVRPFDKASFRMTWDTCYSASVKTPQNAWQVKISGTLQNITLCITTVSHQICPWGQR